MGAYISDCYGFEVKSKQHFMDLVIEPSFNPAICIQFHEMADGSYKAFYNYQPQNKEFVNALKSFYEQNNVDPHTEARVTIEQASSAGVFKPLAPVYCYDLEEEERRCVDDLYINELPFNEEPHWGLDGHSYTLIIFKGGTEKRFESWCVTPRNWETLRKLVKTVVKRLELDPKVYGAYYG